MIIKPRGKYILVECDPPEAQKNQFGILTPTNVERDEKAMGTVISVGPEIKDVKKGEKVIYGTYAGDDISFEEKGKKIKYRLLHDDDVLAFIS